MCWSLQSYRYPNKQGTGALHILMAVFHTLVLPILGAIMFPTQLIACMSTSATHMHHSYTQTHTRHTTSCFNSAGCNQSALWADHIRS